MEQQQFSFFQEGRGLAIRSARPDAGAAARCRAAAEALVKHIQKKHAGADGMLILPPTRRRLAMADSIRREALRLEQIHGALLTLARMHEDGTMTPMLREITSVAAVERVLFDGGPEHPLRPIFEQSKRNESQGEKAARMEREALLKGIPGFVPTPAPVAVQLVRFAGVEAGDKILEPSAGAGAIIDALLQQNLNLQISYCELNCYLLDALRAKYEGRPGVHFATRDLFDLAITGEARFHRVVMNPPFENGRDIEHVRKAYQSLRPGGMLAAIVSEGAFSRADRKAGEFRNFLRTHDADTVSLPTDAFKTSGTRVQCRMVRIRARGELR